MNRQITYREAINEALFSQMRKNKKIINFGVETNMFGSNINLEKFGKKRFFICPLSEDMLTGFALGYAINGGFSVLNHARPDFLLLGMNQLINMISTYSFSTNNRKGVGILIRAVIGRSWGQGFQHSKSMQSIFAHIPGLHVIMPTTPFDAKGMLINALNQKNPVICLEHRLLYFQKGNVPKNDYRIPLGKANILKKGNDITLIATSWMNVEAVQAANFLEKFGISCEVIDLRTLSLFDEKIVFNSINKTRRCLVLDYDWIHCGVSAEISSLIYNKFYKILKAPIYRFGFANTHCPTARELEDQFYPNSRDIVIKVSQIFKKKINASKINLYTHENKFKGPF